MSLTVHNETLSELALFPSFPTTIVMLHDFLLQHSLDLWMSLAADHHETFLRHYNLFQWEDEIVLNIFIQATSPYNLVSKNPLKTLLVDLCIKIRIYSRLKI